MIEQSEVMGGIDVYIRQQKYSLNHAWGEWSHRDYVLVSANLKHLLMGFQRHAGRPQAAALERMINVIEIYLGEMESSGVNDGGVCNDLYRGMINDLVFILERFEDEWRVCDGIAA